MSGCCEEFVPGGSGSGGGGGGSGTVGPGTINTVAKFTAVNTVGDSSILDNGLFVDFTLTGSPDPDSGGFDTAMRVRGPAAFYTKTGPGDNIDVQVFGQLSDLVPGLGHAGELFATNFFLSSTIDCDANPATQVGTAQFGSFPIKVGAGTLQSIGVQSDATGGDDNFSWLSLFGLMQQAGGATFGTIVEGVTIGAGPTAGPNAFQVNVDSTWDPTVSVSLGANVQNFVIPGTAAITPNIGIGVSVVTGAQINTKNTVPGDATGGLVVGLDTTVTAGIRGGLLIYRGPGGGIGGATVAGIAISAGGEFMTGIAANDLAIFNLTAGSKTRFSAGGSSMGASLDAAGVFVARGLVTGDPTVGSGGTGFLALTSQLSPAALAAGSTQNYAPAGLATTNRLRLATNAANSALGGISATGMLDGQIILITNLGAAGTLTLTHQDGGSAAANRFTLEGGVDRVIGVGGIVIIEYDLTNTTWYVVG